MRRTIIPPPGGRKEACDPQLEGGGDLKLTGDISSLKYAFVSSGSKVVGCPVPESILVKLQVHPGGIGRFYEEAVEAFLTTFHGDLEKLVEAAVVFIQERKRLAPIDPTQNANGRVSAEAFQKIQKVQDALTGIKGLSRAKVIAGLIQLNLTRLKQ